MSNPGSDPRPRPPTQAARLLATLDAVLRGTHLQRDRLATGTVEAPARQLLALALLLGGVYGLALGTYALFQGSPQAHLQVVASVLKVPLVFLVTLAVTFPSLYVFAALQRLPLDVGGTLRLLLLAILVHLAVIASLAPVFAFFAASTKSYPFMLLLNVAFFAIGGVLGFTVLRRATNDTFSAAREPAANPPPPPPTADGDAEPAADRGDEAATWAVRNARPTAAARLSAADQTRRVLRTWCIVYGVVGAQTGWLLRPFLGAPDLPFTWFRERENSFFVGVINALRALFSS